MADYYSLLAKAVANLPNKSMVSARRAIYERARKALISQLRTLEPALAEPDVKREETALDAAILRLEAQFATPDGAEAKTAETVAKPAAPPSEAPANASISVPEANPQPPSRPFVSPSRPPTQNPPAGAAGPIPQPPRAPIAPPVKNPTPTAPAPATVVAPSVQLGSAAAPAAPSPAPPIVANNRSQTSEDGLAPLVAASPTEEPLLPPAIRVNAKTARPSAPQQDDQPRRGFWPLVGLAVLIGIVGAVAFAAIQLRQKPQDLAIKAPETAAGNPVASNQNKVVERVPAAGTPSPSSEASTPATTPSTIASPQSIATTPPASPATPAPSPAADASTPAPSTTPAETAATPQTSAPIAVAARAAMLVAVASDPQKPAISLGTVVWSLTPAGAGPGTLPGIRAEVDIPDAKMHAVMTIQKNTLASLPASHTIDLRVTFADGSEIKGIKDMALPQLRRDDSPSAEAVTGARAKINDNYFLVGLTKSDADTARNLDLIATHNWFDFPLLLNDDRIAKLTFEKSTEGDYVVSQALAAWK